MSIIRGFTLTLFSPGSVSDSDQWDTRAAESRETLANIPRLPQQDARDGCRETWQRHHPSAGVYNVAVII